MDIKTKFNIKDIVYFMNSNLLRSGVVERIWVTITNVDQYDTDYKVHWKNNVENISECQLAHTPEELTERLLASLNGMATK